MRILRAIGAWLRSGYWLVAAPPVRADIKPAETTETNHTIRAVKTFNRRERPIVRHWN
jgi:hypothetical protein